MSPSPGPASCYDREFFSSRSENSYRSALEYSEHLSRIFKPASVVDLGCGLGPWLKAFGEKGATKLVGIDGPWVNREDLLDTRIEFVAHDANQLLTLDHEKFDLAICVETAEHLKNESSSIVVSNLAGLSDVVIFSAAYEHQGGRNHINEQRPTYWAKIFIQNGYAPYDFFRPVMWGNNRVEFWYQQNVFLFVKSGAGITQQLEGAGVRPIPNLEFMDCVHPALFDRYVRLAQRRRVRPLVKGPLRKILGPLVRRLRWCAIQAKRLWLNPLTPV